MTNPLHTLHHPTETEFQPYGDLEIVATFGNAPAEYAAIRKGVGRMDLPQRGILEATGRDRLDFLNRFLTNQTFDKSSKTGMAAGKGIYAYLLNGKGRIVADMNVIERGHRTWLEMDARLIESTRLALEKYVITDDVKLTSRVGELHELSVLGAKAAQHLNLNDLQPLESKALAIAGIELTVFRDDPCGVPSFIFVMQTSDAAKVWESLVLRPIGWAMFNAARIEAGRPLMGIDFDETVLPAETGPAQLSRAVSFTKGCYLGQEIVARMHSRGQIARQLVGIRMEEDFLPVAGNQIYDGQSNAVGAITSSTISPILSNAAICLGFVKKAFIEVGTELTIPAEGAMRKGKVVQLPFIHISPA
jgi:aminomethyltransferase